MHQGLTQGLKWDRYNYVVLEITLLDRARHLFVYSSPNCFSRVAHVRVYTFHIDSAAFSGRVSHAVSESTGISGCLQSTRNGMEERRQFERGCFAENCEPGFLDFFWGDYRRTRRKRRARKNAAVASDSMRILSKYKSGYWDSNHLMGGLRAIISRKSSIVWLEIIHVVVDFQPYGSIINYHDYSLFSSANR